jgi:hypothetical protein
MMRATDGFPIAGPTARTLGVRPGVDVPVEYGQVYPGTGGPSVSPDSPLNLPRFRRPPEFGGTGKDPVFRILASELGPHVTYRPDPEAASSHGFLEPVYPMTFADFQRSVAMLRLRFRRVDP